MQRAGDVPFQARVQVGLLLGIPGSSLMSPSAIAQFQTAYAGAQTPEEAQAVGLRERRLAQARMPAGTRSTSGRSRTISQSLEES